MTAVSAAYSQLNQLLIQGQWQAGASSRTNIDTDPFTGETLLEIQQATKEQFNAPFGGEKNSGLGRCNGHWILEEFTRTHWITVLEQGKAQYPL